MAQVDKRYIARELLLRELFQWGYNQDNTGRLEGLSPIKDAQYDVAYFDEIMAKIFVEIAAIDEKIIPFIDRSINSLNKVELAILRLSCYELLYRDDVPFKVCIDQATILAKEYGTDSGYKYINGVLDSFAKQYRANEYQVAQQERG